MKDYALSPAQYQALRLSDCFSDPRLAAIFRRGEDGDPLSVSVPVRPIEPDFGNLIGEVMA